MSLTGLLDLFRDHPVYNRLTQALGQEQAQHLLEAPEAARPLITAALWRHSPRPVLVVAPRPDEARKFHDSLLLYLGEDAPVRLFPEPDVLPFERLVADADANNQRLAALSELHEAVESNDPCPPCPIIVASVAALLQKTLDPESFNSARHSLAVGQEIRLGELLLRWVGLGYQRESSVEIPGSFSHRGGILDIYSPASPLPARLELWGERIESIRLFDPASQRSVSRVESVTVIPAKETLPSLANKERVSDLIGSLGFDGCTPSIVDRFQEELTALFSGLEVEELPLYNGFLNDSTLLDHLPQKTLLVMDGAAAVESEAESLDRRAEELRSARTSRGELPVNFPSPQAAWDRPFLSRHPGPTLVLESWTPGDDGLDFRPSPSYFGRQGELAQDIKTALAGGKRIAIVSRNARRLSEALSEEGLSASASSSLPSPPQPGTLALVNGALMEGWTLPLDDGDLTVFTDSEIFGVAKERRRRRRTPVRRAHQSVELTPGDFVVHVDHGVALFTGTVRMDQGNDEREYLALEYAEGDKLYVPTEHLDRVASYAAPGDQNPNPTRLGTAEWSRVKERVRNATREMARELLDLYASRQVVQGTSFAGDTPWQQELEDAFPYEETDDQARTIREVKADMEQPRPMDRLVCGDVGYGKTEVALRAAFKTASDGLQTGILVPTTVLAQQHYATFKERLSPFPIRVEVLSRFRTRMEQKEVIEGLKTGVVDIVIGTHRLLQKDVEFRDLGLVVVDEEQRFGVAHKERLKRMRQEVDVLTLSATPIPRTLYMGLSGIRDMSAMETPPEERLPVKTYVSEYSDELVKEALVRELERGGQVFFLHNRVKTIRRVAAELSRLVPEARIAVGHGRMAEEELEDVMADFSDGAVDVLVCTTIIESGLDLPNANTLIVDRADRFGLSQLYQLRGRVGRGANRAYSYLLIPKGRRITENASKRLKAILEASELGAGFRVAMRDLEIRGAGNILGPEQSGQVHAVGFELYTQLLNEAVTELKSNHDGAASEQETPPPARVSLSLSAHIEEAYIPHLPTRLGVYHKLARMTDRREMENLNEEMIDRFGPLPTAAENLLYLVDLKMLASEAGVESLTQSGTQSGHTVTLALRESVGGARLALEKALGPQTRIGNQQIHVRLTGPDERWQQALKEVLERLKEFRTQLASALTPG